MKDFLYTAAVYALVGAAVGALIFGAMSLSAWLVMIAWNFLAPTLSLPLIGFWQAFAGWFLVSATASLFRSRVVKVTK